MAVIYIILSLFTAILFILTRDVRVGIEKRDILTIKIDFTFFALSLFKTDKSRKKGKKSKADKRFIYKSITKLLSRSRISILKLNLFGTSDDLPPALAPIWFGNRAVSYAVLAYLKSTAKEVFVTENALSSSPDNRLIYHLILTTPLYRILYTAFAIRLGGIKEN